MLPGRYRIFAVASHNLLLSRLFVGLSYRCLITFFFPFLIVDYWIVYLGLSCRLGQHFLLSSALFILMTKRCWQMHAGLYHISLMVLMIKFKLSSMQVSVNVLLSFFCKCYIIKNPDWTLLFVCMFEFDTLISLCYMVFQSSFTIGSYSCTSNCGEHCDRGWCPDSGMVWTKIHQLERTWKHQLAYKVDMKLAL